MFCSTKHVLWLCLGSDNRFSHDHLCHIRAAGNFKHRVKEQRLNNRTQAAGARFALNRLMCNGFKGFGREFNIHVLHGKKHLILANNGIFRFCQDLNEGFFIEFFKNRNHRQTTDQLRNQTVLHKVTRFNLTEDIREVVILFADDRTGKTDFTLLRAVAHNALHSVKRTAADKEDLGSVDFHHGLSRILAPALDRHGRNGAFDELEKSLLNTLARHVAGNGRVLALAGNLVNFVKIDDALLCTLNVAAGGLHKLGDDILNVFTNVARFRQGRCIRNGKRHIERTSERLSQKRLARTRRADQQHIGLLQLNLVFKRLELFVTQRIQTLVMIEYRHRQCPLSAFLTNYIIVEKLIELPRRRNLGRSRRLRGFGSRLFSGFAAGRCAGEFGRHQTDTVAAEELTVQALKKGGALRLITAAERAVAFCHFLV